MAGKVGKALGFSMDLGETPREKELGVGTEDVEAVVDGAEDPLAEGLEMAEEEAPVAASAEVMAMKMFERAKTPEAKVDALKAFGEACGWVANY
jgi:hypothetical protein